MNEQQLLANQELHDRILNETDTTVYGTTVGDLMRELQQRIDSGQIDQHTPILRNTGTSTTSLGISLALTAIGQPYSTDLFRQYHYSERGSSVPMQPALAY